MFLLTKFALVTCAVYLGIAVLIDGAIFCMARWKALGVFVQGGRSALPGGLAFFGAVWLVAFLISWRIVVTPLLARIHTTGNSVSLW